MPKAKVVEVVLAPQTCDARGAQGFELASQGMAYEEFGVTSCVLGRSSTCWP